MRQSQVKACIQEKDFLEHLINSTLKYAYRGKVATYIPALGVADPKETGIFIKDVKSQEYYAGSYNKKFTLQSISKVLSLIIAILDNGKDEVFSRVGTQPTDKPFNAITDEIHNPMLNEGAIIVTSMINGKTKEDKLERLLDFFRKLSGNENLSVNEDIYISENNTGDMNKAIGYYLKANGKLEGKVEEVLDVYFKQCSIEVTCKDLASIALVLASGGVESKTNKRLIPNDVVSAVLAIMATCGLYNGSGRFLADVGIPAKSGVSGGIMAVVPGEMGIGIYNPTLDDKGNSIVGIKILEELSKSLELNLFKVPGTARFMSKTAGHGTNKNMFSAYLWRD